MVSGGGLTALGRLLLKEGRQLGVVELDTGLAGLLARFDLAEDIADGLEFELRAHAHVRDNVLLQLGLDGHGGSSFDQGAAADDDAPVMCAEEAEPICPY